MENRNSSGDSSRQVSDENRWREPKSRYERNFLSKDCIEAVCEGDRIRVVSEEEKEYRSTIGNVREDWRTRENKIVDSGGKRRVRERMKRSAQMRELVEELARCRENILFERELNK